MLELKEIVQELIEQTEADKIKWSIHSKGQYWVSVVDDCDFVVESNPSKPKMTIFYQSDKEHAAHKFKDDSILTLIECLSNRLPIRDPHYPERALAVAIECLIKNKN